MSVSRYRGECKPPPGRHPPARQTTPRQTPPTDQADTYQPDRHLPARADTTLPTRQTFPPSRHSPALGRLPSPSKQGTATEVGSTHPIGMHSCISDVNRFFLFNSSTKMLDCILTLSFCQLSEHVDKQQIRSSHHFQGYHQLYPFPKKKKNYGLVLSVFKTSAGRI